MEFYLREKDSQRDSRKPTSGSHIQDFCAWSKLYVFDDRQGMQKMFFVKTIDVFSGNEIDLFVPIFVNIKCP
jgi:hypothetical protein